ncbi:inactive protein RESTRICTED TEV MOVEMENT 2-like [Chenopodium quinoa]|uniref:inactive protein RESTRICTED TEV MOVEMENT 2-like n=1 Tax=Chenopodium quinoa TaxID=63459 RepID=UPI000B79A032|nr:inactive protein RESTRICTED TEV MOVEMENT 2-like [Chenopodium quinoa]
MNMRPRGAGTGARRSRLSAAPVYEDFKPTFEWKHDEGASILLYHLPGFAKEQIRIVAESSGILRVRGERLVTSNRWSRFQEEVVVPKDCNMSEIRAKFEAGILTITMPKKTTTITKETPVEKQPNASATFQEPPTSVPHPRLQQNPQPQLQDESSSKPTMPTVVEKPPAARKSVSPPSAMPGKGEDFNPQHKIQQEANVPSHVNPPIDLKQYSNNQGSTNQQISDYVKSKVTNDHKEMREKYKEANYEEQEKHEKFVDALDQEKENFHEMDKNHGNDDGKIETKGQLLMNMGVAILVIVALGTQIILLLRFKCLD